MLGDIRMRLQGAANGRRRIFGPAQRDCRLATRAEELPGLVQVIGATRASPVTGTASEREEARVLTAALKAATPSGAVDDMFDRALAAAEGDESYAALKLVRQVIHIEDQVLGRAPASAPAACRP